MSGESYDRDVQRLITEFEDVLRGMKQERIVEKTPSGHIGRLSITIDNCELALAPFRPDPEEQLLDMMVHAWNVALNPTSPDMRDRTYEERRTIGMRAVLQVIKEKGYFNDQR